MKHLYTLYLALKGYKLIQINGGFILSYDTKNKKFVFWYIASRFKLEVYDSCKDKKYAMFQWKILMKGQG